MRKFYQDYSLVGVVLLFAALTLGFLFRIFNIEAVSAWGDEVASLYYARHLDRVFLHESHTPFYYLICKIWMWVFPDSIISLRYLFILLSTLITGCCSYLLAKKRGIGSAFIFLILWWLWPTDVTFSRQARHYSLYAEMTFFLLILWDYRSSFSRKCTFFIWTVFQFIHPFTLLPVWYLAIYEWARGRASKKETLFYLSSSVPLFCYYGTRFLMFGSEKVFSNITWVSESSTSFQQSLLLLLAGDSFPLNQVYPVSAGSALLFLLLVFLLFIPKRNFISHFMANERLLKFFQIYLITIIASELFSYFFTNIKIGRYFIFLVPFFLYSLLYWINEKNLKLNLKLAFALCFILSIYNIFVLTPWRSYEWDDQNVSAFKSMLNDLPSKELVICANAFQMDYYFKRVYETCSDVALRFHLKKQDFYLFDITGNDKLLLVFLTGNTKIDMIHKFNQAIFISVTYPVAKL
jgi:hypothetical protein